MVEQDDIPGDQAMKEQKLRPSSMQWTNKQWIAAPSSNPPISAQFHQNQDLTRVLFGKLEKRKKFQLNYHSRIHGYESIQIIHSIECRPDT